MPDPSRAETPSAVWEFLSGARSFGAIRIEPSTVTVAAVCLFGLAVFSVFDFREVALIRRDRAFQEEASRARAEREEFALWLADKEDDLNRWLVVIGDPADGETAPTAPSGEAGEEKGSLASIQRTIERIEERFHLVSEFQAGEEDAFWYVPTIAPVALNEKFTIASAPMIAEGAKGGLTGLSSIYGPRLHPTKKKRKMHYGIDIFCPQGTEVRAPANGTVAFAESYRPSEDNLRHSYGRFVVIRHGDSGIETLYAHLSNIVVAKGQLVKRGDPIGYSGQSGQSTAPHLHYEVVRNGVKVDPLNYIHDVALVERGKKVFYMGTDRALKIASRKRKS